MKDINEKNGKEGKNVYGQTWPYFGIKISHLVSHFWDSKNVERGRRRREEKKGREEEEEEKRRRKDQRYGMVWITMDLYGFLWLGMTISCYKPRV